MSHAIDVRAPGSGSYNAAFGDCTPEQAQKSAAKHIATRYEAPSEMCMMRPEKILWSTEDGHRAWRARNERSLNRLLDQHRVEHNAEVMNSDPREQAELLRRATKKPWWEKGLNFFGIKVVRYEPANSGTFATAGMGCIPRHPYAGIKAGCTKVKLDLKGGKNKKGKKVEQKSRIHFVLSHNQIVRNCNNRGYEFVSPSKATTCSPKYVYEKGTVLTNTHWTAGISKAVFEAAGEYYRPTATTYEIKDWRKIWKKQTTPENSIQVYFERCGSTNACSGAIVVCLNMTLIKALTKGHGKQSAPKAKTEKPPS